MKKPWPLFFCVTALWANINTANAGAYAEAQQAMKFPAAPAHNCAAPKKNSCADEKRNNPACEFKYPTFARKNNVEGDLEVEFTADQQGVYKCARNKPQVDQDQRDRQRRQDNRRDQHF